MDWERVSCTVTLTPVGTMAELDGGGDFVHMLPARPGAAGELFLEVRRIEPELGEARGFAGVKIGRRTVIGNGTPL